MKTDEPSPAIKLRPEATTSSKLTATPNATSADHITSAGVSAPQHVGASQIDDAYPRDVSDEEDDFEEEELIAKRVIAISDNYLLAQDGRRFSYSLTTTARFSHKVDQGMIHAL